MRKQSLPAVLGLDMAGIIEEVSRERSHLSKPARVRDIMKMSVAIVLLDSSATISSLVSFDNWSRPTQKRETSRGIGSSGSRTWE